MAVVYPASLGLVEAMSDLFVRAYSSMLAQCTNNDEVSCHHYALYVCIPGGCIAGLVSLALMRVTFARYDTTVALPIEYGALNAGNVCVGLLFYREHSYMTGTQLTLALTGTAIILVGIGVGRLPTKRRGACRQSVKV